MEPTRSPETKDAQSGHMGSPPYCPRLLAFDHLKGVRLSEKKKLIRTESREDRRMVNNCLSLTQSSSAFSWLMPYKAPAEQ